MIHKRFFEEVFVNKIYKPARDWAQKNGAGVVLDVGATTGEFSLWIYPYAEKIYSMEPAKELFFHLEENTKDFPNIQVFNMALSNSNEDQKLLGDVMSGGARLEQGDGGQMVKARTLATFMEDHQISGIDILKIDIEDGEKAVLESSDFPFEKVKFIIGEHLEPCIELFERMRFDIKRYQYGLIAERT